MPKSVASNGKFPPNTLPGTGANDYLSLNSKALRERFLIEHLFVPGELTLHAAEPDRVIVGSVVPTVNAISLDCPAELGADGFCARRELGVFNLGGVGMVTIDGKTFTMPRFACLYVGRGARSVLFSSAAAQEPAQFYLASYPAQHAYPTRLIGPDQGSVADLGTVEASNRRQLRKMIHPGEVESCQLVMGWTRLQSGSVWNTMPPHRHARRSEVYCYFDMAADTRVIHLLGCPQETRHIVVADRQVVISPSWSIHGGAGTGPYSFCWAMGGENQDFADMDHVTMQELR
ncbi:MAG: 5-dehydro-4-deoxy-D-glucuronate isomerase [Methylacidiphilales bacterium]|nr:5-dehydro-4-deoxy-D-glucuronate isomerase [Candidatus Methylacidiphilales bacterium]